MPQRLIENSLEIGLLQAGVSEGIHFFTIVIRQAAGEFLIDFSRSELGGVGKEPWMDPLEGKLLRFN